MQGCMTQSKAACGSQQPGMQPLASSWASLGQLETIHRQFGCCVGEAHIGIQHIFINQCNYFLSFVNGACALHTTASWQIRTISLWVVQVFSTRAYAKQAI